MNIRSIKASDSLSLSLIEKECFSHPWSKTALSDFFDSTLNFGLCAEEDGALCGYVGVTFIIDEAQISNVAVGGKFRRRGIAKMLIRSLIDESVRRKMSVVTLEVRASNLPAIKLYESFGFTAVGRRKNYYTDPAEDAVLYDLKLSI